MFIKKGTDSPRSIAELLLHLRQLSRDCELSVTKGVDNRSVIDDKTLISIIVTSKEPSQYIKVSE